MQGRVEHAKRRSNGGSRPSGSARELLSQSEQLYDDVRAVGGTIRDVTRGWQDLVRAELERRPYATLAVAAGAGYVLGGGLPTTLVRLMVGIGSRVALERIAVRLFVSPGSDGPASAE
jgi:hypothetical protein